MCDGKPYLCSTCHERFDCEKFENLFFKNHLQDIPSHALERITINVEDWETRLGEYQKQRKVEIELKQAREEENDEAKALYEAEMYEMD